MNLTETQEIRRQKVFIPDGLSAREICERFGVNMSTAYGSKKKVSL